MTRPPEAELGKIKGLVKTMGLDKLLDKAESKQDSPCLPKAVTYQLTVQKPFNNQASTPQLHAKFPDRS